MQLGKYERKLIERMDKLFLGMELDDSSCRLFWMNPETNSVQPLDPDGKSVIPACLCLHVENGEWSIGTEEDITEERKKSIIFHHLLSLFRSRQKLEINGMCYTAEDMLYEFLKLVFQKAAEQFGYSEIESLTICLETVTAFDADGISRICRRQGIEPQKIHVLNRQECFMYYLMSQKREMWSNVSYLFDYGEYGLYCYELNVLKGIRPIMAKAQMEWIDEAPSVQESRDDDEKSAEADRWFASLSEKKMTGKIVSSVILCGDGFSKISWAKQFIKSIYSQKSRKIYQVENIFGMGATFAAYHAATEYRDFPYCCICDGRLTTTISIFMDENDTSEQVILAQAGMNCYEARIAMDLNLIEQKNMNLFIRNAGAQESRKLSLDLSSFMEDGRDRTKIRLLLFFPKEDTMIVKVEDLGFGEIYPSTAKVFQQTYKI